LLLALFFSKSVRQEVAGGTHPEWEGSAGFTPVERICRAKALRDGPSSG
jgi:hypothetical protein